MSSHSPSPSPSPPPVHQSVSVAARRFQFCPEDGHRFGAGEKACPVCGSPVDPLDFAAHASLSSTTAAAAAAGAGVAANGRPVEEPQQAPRSGPRWQKLLYVKQGYPDNYVDHTFLEAMERNANLISYEYWTLVVESGGISQHISSVAIFIALFTYFSERILNAKFLLLLAFGLTLTGYGYWHLTAPNKVGAVTPGQALKGAILFMSMLLLLSPILRTLTEDYSEDTIYTLTTICFLANVLLHDYGASESAGLKKGTLSLNAAIFGSVLLASRLRSNIDVFALMGFAIVWFALFPMLRKHVKIQSQRTHTALTTCMFLAASATLFSLTIAIGFIYTIGMLFVTFVCPFWLMWLQRYKNEIHGPWDEARLNLRPGDQSGGEQ